MSYAPVGGISQDGYLTTVHMDQAKADAYNNAVMEVQNDSFMQMDAEQYMANQQVTASDAFSAAVDNYVANTALKSLNCLPSHLLDPLTA